MPLPLAHSIVGVAACVVFRPESSRGRNAWCDWRLLAVSVLLANAADLDFLPGLLVNDPHRYHHGVSHSLLAALLLGLAAFALSRNRFPEISPLRLFLVFATASLSHPLLDYLSADYGPPYGVPLFWPVSDAYQISPVPLFLDVRRDGASNESFFVSLFNLHNLRALGVEVLFGITLTMTLLGVTGTGPTRWRWLLTAPVALAAFLFFALRMVG